MSELSDAINEMRNMRESYDQLGAAAEAYNAGKSQLVENLNSKGIPASATETLPELAEKVGAIAQTQTILEGGEVMAAQQFGDGTLWNLYQVLADMKTRFMGNGDYAALIVCEYYKGYDSLQLQGADAYYTCDGDLYEYASPNHVWHDADNGKMNRWVAFLYRNAGARLDITNTDISPCSMYIGGHIGTIEYFVNGRLTELVSGVEETDVLDYFLSKTFTQNWGRNCIIRGVRNVSAQDNVGFICGSDGLVYVESANKDGAYKFILNYSGLIAATSASSIYVRGYGDIVMLGYTSIAAIGANAIAVTIKDAPRIRGVGDMGGNRLIIYSTGVAKLEKIDISDTVYINGADIFIASGRSYPNLRDIVVGEMISNLNARYWNPTNVLADSTKKAQLIENIKNHILARVSDATGGTQLVFTVSTNMYNSIASEQIEWQGETMSLADAFLTKNWLLAGA